VNGKPIDLSPNQQKVFDLILYRQQKRSQIIMPTQYGKSLTVAIATELRAITKGERFTILAPSEKKAGIIMGYLIDHLFDQPFLLDQLELDSSTKLDKLRRERSRDNLTFKGGGGVKTLTLDSRNGKRSIEAAMGFGGKRLILDESSLIDDTLYATVKRMLGGYSYEDTFLLEIGNPFYRNHFYRTWQSSRYNKIFVDYKVALEEGRFSPEFIEEMREEAFFDVFYECRFPDEDDIDERGYRVLVTNDLLDQSFVDHAPAKQEGLKLGIDVGAGGDENVYVLRSADVAWVESHNRSNDTMTNVTETQRIMDAFGVKPEDVFIDDIGVGRGVSDRLQELGYAVNGVSVGEKPQDETKYKNIKAEAYWNTRVWLMAGGKLVKNDKFRQLAQIKYKTSTDKVLQIEPKEELKKRTGKSPDYAEALMLTHVQPPPEPGVRLL
jgi:uncharacterized SAM-binding protein YcdF (DUF218 family)